MNKQPLLTNFPSHILASAKRRKQAEIQKRRQRANRGSLCDYALLFNDVLRTENLSKIDPTRRQRHFGQLIVFWAWLAQILELNASCSRAVRLIQSWYLSAKIRAPKNNTGSYCKARIRLSLDLLKSVFDQVNEFARRQVRTEDQWHGFNLKAIDGSSVTLLDTEPNQVAYPQHSSSKKGCGFPIMGFVAVANLSTGGWEGIETCPQNTNDAKMAPKLLHHFGENDLLLADRAFCSYQFLGSLRAQRKSHFLVRLHQSRHKALNWRKGKRIGKHQRIVT